MRLRAGRFPASDGGQVDVVLPGLLSIVALLVMGCQIVDSTSPSRASAEDLASRSGSACIARLSVSYERPTDIAAVVDRAVGPGWITPERLFVGSLTDLGDAIAGSAFGIEGDVGYVNGLTSTRSWATFILQRTPTQREAWFVTVVVAATSCAP